jgi:hypothetical protein
VIGFVVSQDAIRPYPARNDDVAGVARPAHMCRYERRPELWIGVAERKQERGVDELGHRDLVRGGGRLSAGADLSYELETKAG